MKVKKNPWVAYIFVLPAVFLYTMFVVFPIIQATLWSFFQWDGLSDKVFIGLDNFYSLIHDSVFWLSLEHTLITVVFSVGISISVGVILAVFIDRFPRRLADILRAVYFMPLILSLVAVSLIWGWFYNPQYGLLNSIIGFVLGKTFLFSWLGNPRTTLIAILAARTWREIGFTMVVFLAGLRGIPQHYYEAARIDGASLNQCTWYITFPLLKPAFAVLLLLETLGSLRTFDTIYIMARGGPYYASEVLTTHMYKQAFYNYKLGYASAIAIALFILAMITTWIIRSTTERIGVVD